MLFKTAYPNFYTLKERFSICGKGFTVEVVPGESSSDNNKITINCNSWIPVDIVYKAQTINFHVQTNQRIDLKITFMRNGFGALGVQSSIASTDNNFTLVSKKLEDVRGSKINWLTGDYNELVFDVDYYNNKEDLLVEIKDIYLK